MFNTAPTRPPVPWLTTEEARALNLEFLALLDRFGRPATVETLFDQCRPRWALDTADRLIVAGYLRRLADGSLELTEAGRLEHRRGLSAPKPAPRPINLVLRQARTA